MRNKNIYILIILIISFSGCGDCSSGDAPPMSIEYNITNITCTASSDVVVDYTVDNIGDLDLTGIKIKFGVDFNGGFDEINFTEWSDDFDINSGSSKNLSTQIFHTSINGICSVVVIGNGWNNPSCDSDCDCDCALF